MGLTINKSVLATNLSILPNKNYRTKLVIDIESKKIALGSKLYRFTKIEKWQYESMLYHITYMRNNRLYQLIFYSKPKTELTEITSDGEPSHVLFYDTLLEEEVSGPLKYMR